MTACHTPNAKRKSCQITVNPQFQVSCHPRNRYWDLQTYVLQIEIVSVWEVEKDTHKQVIRNSPRVAATIYELTKVELVGFSTNSRCRKRSIDFPRLICAQVGNGHGCVCDTMYLTLEMEVDVF